jgi:hypothetical protein
MSSAPTAEPAPPEDEPKGLLDKLGAALPIALTAIATAFAGMSTSELQQAMFWRSAAAQDQAKATNQWTLAGFKRDRSLTMQSTAATLRAQAGYPDLGLDREPRASGTGATNNPTDSQGLDWLQGKGPPPAKLQEVADGNLKELLRAIRERDPEEEILKKARMVPQAGINHTIDDAEKAVEQIDREWDPVVKAATKYVQDRVKSAAGVKPDDKKGRAGATTHATGLQAALFEMEQRRYRAEATLNQGIGFLYEARVKVSTAESDRHRERSKNFFYAMLVGQIGAVISSLALARKRKSALWLLAGLSGVVAVAIGAYVYIGI